MPAVLQQFMQHESDETTMRYYVGRDADAVADALWSAAEQANRTREGNGSGNVRPDWPSKAAEEKSQAQSKKSLSK